MNDFDNENFNQEPDVKDDDCASDTEPGVTEDNAAGEVREHVEGINFNSDGTYHGVHEEKKSENTEAVKNEDSSYSSPQAGYSYYRTDNFTSGQSNNNPGNGYGYQQPGASPYGNAQYNYPPRNPVNQNNANPYGQYNPYSAKHEGYAYPEDKNNNDKKNNKAAKIVGIVAGILCVLLIALLVALALGGDKTPIGEDQTSASGNVSENVEEFETSASPVTGEETAAEGEMTPKNIYKSVLPSSVGILVYTSSKTLASEGSGVLFQESSDGKYTYIVTCAHVISETSGKIRVQTYDSKEYDAEVVGYDARTDIGVIRIAHTGFDLAEIGDSSQISVGDPIYAIGNPGGVEFANSFTNGIVSALDRPVNSSATGYTTECIQHTAAINPGNSGGALVNSFGQVIGINSMKIVADEYEGMGFAVPSSVFVKIVNEIMANGYVSNRPKLGITYVPASEYSDYGMFVAIKGLPSGSIVIYSISSDSSLASSNVKEGDMIVSVNGVDLDDPSYLSELIENSNVGDTITLGIIRINDDYTFEEFDAEVTLVEDRGDSFAAEESEPSTDSYSGDSYEDYFNDFFEDYFNDRFGGYAP